MTTTTATTMNDSKTSTSRMNSLLLSREYQGEESPRPTKRRHSGPCMDQTPRNNNNNNNENAFFMPSACRPLRMPRLLKTPPAPCPAHRATMLFVPPLLEDKPALFLPGAKDLFAAVDDGASTTSSSRPLLPLTRRLKPRRTPTWNGGEMMMMTTGVFGSFTHVTPPPHLRPLRVEPRLKRTASMTTSNSKSTSANVTEHGASMMTSSTDGAILMAAVQEKAWPTPKAVPAPTASRLKATRSCHALCA